MNLLTNALIGAGAVGIIGYALMTHLQNRAPRRRASASVRASSSEKE